MLNIRIIFVGKFKEKYWEAASAEYMKRLWAYCSISVIEVKEESDLDSLFRAGGTTALAEAIHGLDDFELLAFLVIKAGDSTV